jgi:hypothetical protein
LLLTPFVLLVCGVVEVCHAEFDATAVTAMYEKKQCRLGWRAYVAADVAEVPKDDHVAKTVSKAAGEEVRRDV